MSQRRSGRMQQHVDLVDRRASQFRGLYKIMPDYTLTPDIRAEREAHQDQAVDDRGTIKKKAVWSDGIPVTYQDFVYTWTSDA